MLGNKKGVKLKEVGASMWSFGKLAVMLAPEHQTHGGPDEAQSFYRH